MSKGNFAVALMLTVSANVRVPPPSHTVDYGIFITSQPSRTQLTLRPDRVHIWSRYPRKCALALMLTVSETYDSHHPTLGKRPQGHFSPGIGFFYSICIGSWSRYARISGSDSLSLSLSHALDRMIRYPCSGGRPSGERTESLGPHLYYRIQDDCTNVVSDLGCADFFVAFQKHDQNDCRSGTATPVATTFLGTRGLKKASKKVF